MVAWARDGSGHRLAYAEETATRVLVERAKAADADAWEALYCRAYPRLLAYATRRLDADRGRDAVGETMVRAVEGISRFQWQHCGFEGWLFGILRHVVIDAQRACARDRERVLWTDPVSAPGPLDELLHGEEMEEIRAAFAELDPGDRELLELRVVGGLSSEDVAAVLGRRPGAVRMAQTRALERLRQRLKERV